MSHAYQSTGHVVYKFDRCLPKADMDCKIIQESFFLKKYKPGDTVTITFKRGAKVRKGSLTFGEVKK